MSTSRTLFALAAGILAVPAADVQFVITSDVHYGHTRAFAITDTINGGITTDAVKINAMLVKSVNAVSTMTFPADGGVAAGTVVGGIDLVAVTGDLATRFEATGLAATNNQKSAIIYGQFSAGWLSGVTLKNTAGASAKWLLTTGNHDVSNAIGNVKIPAANVDGSALTEILKVAKAGTATVYAGDSVANLAQYNVVNASGAAVNRPNYSQDINGIHFVSVSIWPDTANRKWIDADLKSVPLTTPVFLFMHDYPDVDPKHLSDPISTVPTANREFCVSDVVDPTEAGGTSTAVEQRALVAWLKLHPNIVAYFHGHSNSNEMWTYTGPDNDISLRCFRNDSPMKGDVTAAAAGAETLMSYQIASVDFAANKLTVRELRWYPTTVFSTDVTTAANARSPKVANVPKLDIPLTVAAPTFSVASGTYATAQTVTLTSSTAATAIYYTTDGSTPTLSSTKYTTPITVSVNTTVRAVNVPTGFVSMAPKEAAQIYAIGTGGVPAPVSTSDDSKGRCGVGGVSMFGAMLGLWLLASRRKA